MNVYFLVEGKRTEMKVYPKWLAILVPTLQRVTSPQAVVRNQYYLFSGEGFPSLLDNHLRNAVADVNDSNLYNYFVICLDADEQSREERKQEVLDFMSDEKIALNPNTQLKIIVQNKCFETWLLGNSKIFKANPSDERLKKMVQFYNVRQNDPEIMGKPFDFEGSTSIFHSQYLSALLLSRKVSYTKKNPQAVVEKHYLDALIARSEKTKHIASFQSFIDFCEHLKKNI
jgi:hypothetical protein